MSEKQSFGEIMGGTIRDARDRQLIPDDAPPSGSNSKSMSISEAVDRATREIEEKNRPGGDTKSNKPQAMAFRNPANGHIETVSPYTGVWTFLFGGIDLIFKGLGLHALIWFIAAVTAIIGFGDPGLLVITLLNVVYAVSVKSLLRAKYLRGGWVEVADDDVTDEVAPVDAPNQDTHIKQEAHSGFIADELRKLASLRDDGVLTDDEFAVQKDKLLKA